jgi:phosphotransferase system enzyme I (PtsI)
MGKNLILKGIAASWGIGFGKATIIPSEIIMTEEILGKDAEKALQKTKKATLNMIEELMNGATDEVAGILKAHKLMVEAIIDEALELVKSGKGAIEAITLVADKYIDLLKTTGSPLIQLRSDDLVDIKNTLIRNLTESKELKVDEDSIIISEEIYPSQLLRYAKKGIAGIITEKGSYTSHVAIIARSLEIPAVFGIKNATKTIKEGDPVVVDGFLGNVIIKPNRETIEEYKKREESFNMLFKKFEKTKAKAAVTKDGKRILVMANIGNEEDLNTALVNGCDGVGLFRIEFYFLNRKSPPTSKELIRLLKKFTEKLKEKHLTVRLLDIGGDKNIPYLEFPKESNPFLGVRGIRYLLKHRKLLEDQLKAILTVSEESNVRVMAPMVSTLQEVRELKNIIKKLSEKNKGDIKVGIMVEVPSILFIAEKIVKEVDFLSIGTNDLTQYIFAADRTNANVSYLYDDMHPAVLRAIAEISNKAHKVGIPVDVCGELASNPLAVPILIGLGINELSVSPTMIPIVKWIVRNISYKDAKEVAEKVLNFDNGQQVRDEIRRFIKEKLEIELLW